jgi:integrase
LIVVLNPEVEAGGTLVVVARSDGPVFEAKWRRRGRQFKRRLGPAWLERDASGAWRPRRGRVPEGFLDERRAILRLGQLVVEHDARESEIERGERERRDAGVTFREVAAQWLEQLEHERGAKPSTLQDYRYALAEPGTPHRRGRGQSRGSIMRMLGDLPAVRITTRQVSALLREVQDGGGSPRTVNKTRQLLSAIFNYARAEHTFGLPSNPVVATTKRREPPAAVLDFFEPEEIDELARAAAAGAHRGEQPADLEPDEIEWRAREDAQDAELYRIAAFTGLRLGEILPLCWEDVDVIGRRLVVHRAVSAGVEGPTKTWQARFIPLADPAAEAFVRLKARGHYTQREDYVFCSRLGQRLDGSAVRRRYKRARDAIGLRPLRFHALRHGAGSLVARHSDAHFVQGFLGHSRITTTERYMHAKARPEDVERVNLAFRPNAKATSE